MNFGENLQRLLAKKGLTQKELARATNVPQQSVSRWVKSAAPPRAATVNRLAAALEVDAEDLLDPPDLPSSARGVGTIVPMRVEMPAELANDIISQSEFLGHSASDEIVSRLKSTDLRDFVEAITVLTRELKRSTERRKRELKLVLKQFQDAFEQIERMAEDIESMPREDLEREITDFVSEMRGNLAQLDVDIDMDSDFSGRA